MFHPAVLISVLGRGGLLGLASGAAVPGPCAHPEEVRVWATGNGADCEARTGANTGTPDGCEAGTGGVGAGTGDGVAR